MSSERFIKELRIQFDRFVQHKERLDNKANNMIAISGTIATLFMGFGALLLSDVIITKNNELLVFFTALCLMLEVSLTVFTIRFALDSYKLRSYHHPIGHKAFYDSSLGEWNHNAIAEYVELSEDDFDFNITLEYLEGIKSYEIQNDLQVKGINYAQRTLVTTVIIIPIFTILILLVKFSS